MKNELLNLSFILEDVYLGTKTEEELFVILVMLNNNKQFLLFEVGRELKKEVLKKLEGSNFLTEFSEFLL